MPINYLFFGLYFFIITALHVFHVFLIESKASLSTCFFVAYALAQCMLETLGLVILAGIIIQHFPRFKSLFVLGVFFLLIGHLIDFPLVRLMDMSFWYALSFVTQMSYENFVELLLASNVSVLVWVMAALGSIVLMLSGVFLYRLTEILARKRQLVVPSSMLGASLVITSLFLVSWDYSFRGRVSTNYFDRFQKTLPWKATLFSQKNEYLSLKSSLQEPLGEEELMRSLDSRYFSLARKPDIYLFVIESLREDYITQENAPHLNRFKKQNISFDLALSNANATHISWFSLFHSQFPFYWGKFNPEEVKGGSIPLQLLKKMGYKVYVSSSARLVYFQMNRVIFGEGEYLADSLFIPDDEECDEPYKRDQKAIENLLGEMQTSGAGRVFIVFLDATHHDYSWPNEISKFYPFDEKINYINASVSKKGLEKIKNRYRNSLFFIDDQMGKFLDTLENVPGGKDAIVVVTGDHGEEFYEHGNLFHASSLTHPQMHTALYYRFGQNQALRPSCKMSCHMDIFPTIFHYLLGEDLMGGILQGESIFKKDRWPYTVVARFNAISSPYEFCIHNGSYKLLMSFNNRQDIFNAKGLKIISAKNCQDESISKEFSMIHEEFGPAFERIFPSSIQ